MTGFDEGGIDELYQSELRDPRKRRWRIRRSNLVEFYDTHTGQSRHCHKWEREFENRQVLPVRHVDQKLWHPKGEPRRAGFVGTATQQSNECPWIPPASKEDIRRELFGSRLAEIADWKFYATWTFSRLVTGAGALHFARKHLRFVARWDVDTERGGTTTELLKRGAYKEERERRKDERERYEASSDRLQAFIAVERGEVGRLLHLHALLAKISHLRAFCGYSTCAWRMGQEVLSHARLASRLRSCRAL